MKILAHFDLRFEELLETRVYLLGFGTVPHVDSVVANRDAFVAVRALDNCMNYGFFLH